MLSGMVSSLSLRDRIWLCVSIVEVLFLVYLTLRRVYRSHLFFFLYGVSLVLQTVSVALVYRYWSSEYSYAAWISQALITGMRWLAIAEIARNVLARYSGIWRLANTILFVLGLTVLAYAMLTSDLNPYSVVMAADRGVELCIAVFVVGMFTFAKYYRLPISDVETQLAIGFCLYSCVWVVNETIYLGPRRWLGPIWDFALTIAFLASVALWSWALRAPAASPANAPQPKISPEFQAELSEQVNSGLLTLNRRLNHLLRSEDSRS